LGGERCDVQRHPISGLVHLTHLFDATRIGALLAFLLVVTLRSRRDAADTGTVVAPRGGSLSSQASSC